MLEHRYYGLSNPFDDLSDEHLRFHTIQQAIDDFEYFAKNVKLPQPDGDSVKPGQAPWVLIAVATRVRSRASRWSSAFGSNYARV